MRATPGQHRQAKRETSSGERRRARIAKGRQEGNTIDLRHSPGVRGRQALVAEFHRMLAVHYWWLHPKRHAAKTVAREWGLSVAAVRKYAYAKREAAQPTVDVFKADKEQSAVAMFFKHFAEAFRALGN